MMPRILIWARPIPPWTFLVLIWPADASHTVQGRMYLLNLKFSDVTNLSDLDLTLKIVASWLSYKGALRFETHTRVVVFPPS
jgi:hypothetical protein